MITLSRARQLLDFNLSLITIGEKKIREIIKKKKSIYNLKTVMNNQQVKELIDNGMTVEQVREAEELIAQGYDVIIAGGLTPENVASALADDVEDDLARLVYVPSYSVRLLQLDRQPVDVQPALRREDR